MTTSIAAASPHPWWGLRRLRRWGPARRPTVTIAAGFIALVVIAAVFASPLSPYAPNAGSLAHRLAEPGTTGHLLGTDGQGRDVLSRLIWGAGSTLISGLAPVAAATALGTVLGVIAGLGGRWIEGIVMRVLDVLFAFPAVLLAIALSAALGAGEGNTIISLTVVLIPPIARVAVVEVKAIRRQDYMEVARASGASWPRIVLWQVLPNAGPAVLTYATTLIGLSIVYSAGLSLLGLGVQPPQPAWGETLNDLRQNIFETPALALVPAIAIFLLSAAFNVVGDSLALRFGGRATEVPSP